MPIVRLALSDGRKLEVDPSGPWSGREQVDWEQQFRASFATVYKATAADMAAARAAEEAGEDDPSTPVHFRMTWILWFAWHRLRRQGEVPGRWEAFLDSLDDYDFEEDQADEQAATDGAGDPAGDGSVDPTLPAESSAPAA